MKRWKKPDDVDGSKNMSYQPPRGQGAWLDSVSQQQDELKLSLMVPLRNSVE